METYLVILSLSGGRRANIVRAPDTDKAESLMRQAHNERENFVLVWPVNSPQAIDFFEEGRVQLGYPLTYSKSRRLRLTMDVAWNVDEDKLRALFADIEGITIASVKED